MISLIHVPYELIVDEEKEEPIEHVKHEARMDATKGQLAPTFLLVDSLHALNESSVLQLRAFWVNWLLGCNFGECNIERVRKEGRKSVSNDERSQSKGHRLLDLVMVEIEEEMAEVMS